MCGGVHDVITGNKFHQNRLRGFRATGVQKSSTPIDLACRPYNSSALPCWLWLSLNSTLRRVNLMLCCWLLQLILCFLALSCAETAEPIYLPFCRLGPWTRVGRRKHKFNRIHHVAPICPHRRTVWRHLANTIKPSICGGDAVLCQITLTTCFRSSSASSTSHARYRVAKYTQKTFNYLQNAHRSMLMITVSTVVLNCCKGDRPSQWEYPIFGPL